MSQILKEKEYVIKKSSGYRETILEMVDIVRKKAHKYTQTTGEFGDVRNRTRVCVMGLYNTEKNGGAYTFKPGGIEGMIYGAVVRFNDRNRWTFNQIADELERGVALLT